MKRSTRRWSTSLLIVTILVLAAAPLQAGAGIVRINPLDPPNLGFNDPTPVAPVGGNPGTTLGEQRLNVFNVAAGLWSAVLDTPVDIWVQVTFNPENTFVPLFCDADTATLGASATNTIWANFPGGLTNLWYPAALTNHLAGVDGGDFFFPPSPDAPPFFSGFNDEILSLFNDRLDSDPSCLGGVGWYYGYDHNAGNSVDLLNVVMHEFAHGLGFASFIDETTGVGPDVPPLDRDIFSLFTGDASTGKRWVQMSNAEIVTSAVNDPNVVWIGPSTAAAASSFLAPRPSAFVVLPSDLAGTSIEVQPAEFGPPVPTSGFVRVGRDGVGNSFDACEPLINNVVDQIAMVLRGNCDFDVKVANAQAAGARGVVVANNQWVGIPPMGGDGPGITIPSWGMRLPDAWKIRRQLQSSGVYLTFGPDLTVLAGTTAGFPRLYAPKPAEPGSGISHWDTTLTPDAVMEPFISPDLQTLFDLDLTPYVLQDMGWDLEP